MLTLFTGCYQSGRKLGNFVTNVRIDFVMFSSSLLKVRAVSFKYRNITGNIYVLYKRRDSVVV